MKRLSDSSQQAEKSVDISMAPLIDCVFLLLIFFIVTTVFVKESGVDIQKPRAVTAEGLDANSILITLTSENRILYGGRQVPLSSVRGLVTQHLREKKVPVILIADEASRSGSLVELIDECKLGGADQVSVAAQKPL